MKLKVDIERDPTELDFEIELTENGKFNVIWEESTINLFDTLAQFWGQDRFWKWRENLERDIERRINNEWI